jgi:hypothetical protein
MKLSGKIHPQWAFLLAIQAHHAFVKSSGTERTFDDPIIGSYGEKHTTAESIHQHIMTSFCDST